LKRVLTEPPASLAGFIAGQAAFQNPPTEMMFAITAFSSNQHGTGSGKICRFVTHQPVSA